MMQLDEDESRVKTFFHHPFPFVLTALKAAIASLPFFFVATFFSGLLDTVQMFLVYLSIAGVFLLAIAYLGAIYFLDRLVITNKRVIHVEWKSLFNVEESEAEFEGIQDIETTEHGILSAIPLFDYGNFEVSTASSKVAVVFDNANDPEGIKHFIYHLQRKPSRIVVEAESPEAQINDRTYEKDSQAAGIRRSDD